MISVGISDMMEPDLIKIVMIDGMIRCPLCHKIFKKVRKNLRERDQLICDNEECSFNKKREEDYTWENTRGQDLFSLMMHSYDPKPFSKITRKGQRGFSKDWKTIREVWRQTDMKIDQEIISFNTQKNLDTVKYWVGVRLMMLCRKDISCPYKAMLPETDVDKLKMKTNFQQE